RDFINPTVTGRNGSIPSEEGCLSIPDYRDVIKRSARITVKAYDRTGAPFELEAEGLLAVCIQHEIDHLDGVLFIDHLSRLKREFFRRWFKKQQNIEE
ncbi:MAG: peptide deformylase, partial [Bdellovibrionales bacterium]|nr:peptide deformylase [Bdellovibrionales bacterium]